MNQSLPADIPEYQGVVSPTLQHVLDSLTLSPALVMDQRWNVIAWNKAAYYKVLYNMLNLPSKSQLSIPIMVDMRRNLKDRNADAFCNLSSTAITHIDYDTEDNFYDTLMKVNKDMN